MKGYKSILYIGVLLIMVCILTGCFKKKIRIENLKSFHYSYSVGYYMNAKDNISASSLYNHHQEMLRIEADKLHELLEMQYLPKIINMDNLEEFNKAFADYKGKILTLMSATTKFKENILVDIENHPDYIDYNLLKNLSNNSRKQSLKKKK